MLLLSSQFGKSKNGHTQQQQRISQVLQKTKLSDETLIRDFPNNTITTTTPKDDPGTGNVEYNKKAVPT